MKKIRKIAGKTAVSILAGATLIGAASAALGDYPKPFVDEDGNLDTNIIVGENAKTVDVVGAINIAGSLGQDAVTEKSMTVSGQGTMQWSSSDGVTLDTRNDNLFFGSSIDSVRQTLTEEHLDVLQTREVFTGDEKQDVEQYLYIGNQGISYGTPGDADNEDPFLYVNNPSSVSTGKNSANNLYQLQANFEEGVQFNDESEDDDRNTDVYGEEVSMFGSTFTVSDDSFYGSNSGQLVLYGSQTSESVSTGESSTLSVGGQEVSVSVVGVTGSNTAAVEIDGDLEEYNEDDDIDVNGETLRVDNIIQTNSDNSQGTVKFAVGSQKVVLEDGSEVMVGEDEEDVDGTQVSLSGTNTGNGDVDPSGNDDSVELSSLSVAVGADDSDNSYVRADQPFEDPVFGGLKFSFGGLSPDTADSGSASAETVEVSTDGDDTATVSFEGSSGDSSTVSFFHRNSGANNLADDDNDKIVAVEGDAVQEDEYVLTDAGDFSHMWEVTSLDADQGASTTGDEATIEMEDAITGASVDVNLDADDEVSGFSAEEYAGTEVIDGQTYYFAYDSKGTDTTTDDSFSVTWGTDADYDKTGSGSSGVTTAFPTVETRTGARLGFYESGQDPSDFGTDLISFNTEEQFVDQAGQSTEGANGYGDGDSIIRDNDKDDVYTSQSDNDLAGNTSMVNAVSLSTGSLADWSGTTTSGTVSYYDSSTGDAWDSNNDAIWKEGSGGADDVFYSNNDTLLAGTAPADDTPETGDGGKTSDWTTISLYDYSSGNTWDGTNDAVIKDFHGGGTYSANADTKIVDNSPGAGASLTSFASSTKHDEPVTSNSQYDNGENIVDDSDSSGDYSSGDTVLLGSLTGSSGLQYWSSDADETNKVSGLKSTLSSGPSMFFITEENDADVQESYVVAPSWDSGDSEVEVGGEDSSNAVSFTGSRTRKQMESDDDIYGSYDSFGTYVSEDTGDRGSVTLKYPGSQATAGAAFTTADGSLSAEGGATGSVTSQTPTGWPDAASLDSEGTPETSSILVGGPAVNTLVQDLVEANKTMPGSEYSQGQGMIQYVEEAFDQNDALIIAGYSGEDTRTAANYIANYQDHQDALAGQDEVSINTAQGSVVQ